MSTIYAIILNDRYYDEGAETPVCYKITEEEAISFCKESNANLIDWSKQKGMSFHGDENKVEEILQFGKENNIVINLERNTKTSFIFLFDLSVKDLFYKQLKGKIVPCPSESTYLRYKGYSEYATFEYLALNLEENNSI